MVGVYRSIRLEARRCLAGRTEGSGCLLVSDMKIFNIVTRTSIFPFLSALWQPLTLSPIRCRTRSGQRAATIVRRVLLHTHQCRLSLLSHFNPKLSFFSSPPNQKYKCKATHVVLGFVLHIHDVACYPWVWVDQSQLDGQVLRVLAASMDCR